GGIAADPMGGIAPDPMGAAARGGDGGVVYPRAMPGTRVNGPLPPDVEARVRAYLAAFLPADAVDDAVAEVASDSGFWGDTDVTEVLAVAHAVLASRLRVATDVEVLVLNEDAGLSVTQIAAVLALPPAEVRRILDDALAVLADVDGDADGVTVEPEPLHPRGDPHPGPRAPADETAPVSPATAAAPTATPPPRRRRRQRVLLLGAALAVVGVALVAAWSLGGSDGCSAGVSLCVTDAVLTDEVDASTGAPGADRASFGADDPVTLWFAFERQGPEPGPLEVRWYREGTLLYTTEVRLGSGDRLNVSLAGLWSDQPGRYRVEVAERGQVLLERDFRIEG
ncbi:MAG: hypothetical protein KY457_05625, partial [Actinobacteria bacterium]|nr:hypothetical protein [Actinomycetota bacterium]